MPLYSYTARDGAGRTRSGSVDARSESLAVALLKEQGLYVVTLSEKKGSFVDKLSSFKGVPENEVVVFTRQLSTMISAGLPISRALEVLTEQTPNQGMRKVLFDILRDIEGGASLETAFSRYPRVFPPTYQSLVSAGEASGKLDEILQRLADSMEAQRDLKSKFVSALIYPAIVFIAMIGVFILMMVFVVPKLATMYESLGAELPGMTKFMISMSNFMVHRYYIVILGVVGIAVGLRSFAATDFGKDFLSRLAFTLPVFGKINKQRELAVFTRTLSLLIASAIPIVEALMIASKVTKNTIVQSATVGAARSVEKGNSLSDYLRSNKVFPPLLAQMASVGEETGQMDSVLNRIADFFAGETEHAVKGLSSALEPIILIMLGGMVGLLIVSIITPIYKITSSI